MNRHHKTTRFGTITATLAFFALAAAIQAPGSVSAKGTAEDADGMTTSFDISARLTDGPPSGSVRLASKDGQRSDETVIVATELEKIAFDKQSARLIGPAVMRKAGPVGPAEYHGSIEVWLTSGDQSSLRAVFHSVEGYDAWEFNGHVTRGTVAIEPPVLLTK